MCNKALVAGVRNNITWNSSYRRQYWSVDGDEIVSSQNTAFEIQVWCADDIGIAGGRIGMVAYYG